MIMKVCMEQYVLKFYKVYVNDDPELTLTRFKTKSYVGETCFCTYSRPIYQVSDYSTIGPLVFIYHRVSHGSGVYQFWNMFFHTL